MTVTLTETEVAQAILIGSLRLLKSRRQGNQNAFGFRGAGWNVDILGACGELAVAKALGIYWPATVNAGKAPDLRGLQVRTASLPTDRLIVRDNDQGLFVFTYGEVPTFTIAGWISAEDAKQEQFKTAPNGRPAAYFVPQSELQSLDELPTLGAM